MSILLNSLAALAYAGAGSVPSHATPDRPASRWWKPLGITGWLLHGAGLAGFFFIGPDAPVFGWSLALSITAWLLVAIHGLESEFLQRATVPRAVWWIAAGLCLLVLLAPPTRTVAAGESVWFTLHWVLGLAAYGLIAAAVLHGVWLWRSEDRLHDVKGPAAPAPDTLPLLMLEKLMMRLTWAGFIMLSISVLFGVVLGEQLTGRPFKSDHKTIFSLLAWGVFAGLLLANRALGLRGKRAVKWLMAGSVLLLLGYVGSRFVLDVVLNRP